MSGFSLINGAFSVVPFIGPIVADWNQRSLDQSGPSHTEQYLRETLPKIASLLNPIVVKNEQSLALLESIEKKDPNYDVRVLSHLKDKMYYSFCGKVSSVLSVAATVALIATGILKLLPGIVLLVVYAKTASRQINYSRQCENAYFRQQLQITSNSLGNAY
ncbi:MAG: hypothetical protein COT85_05410 [Chlamydiae bacterium CG10_big_fil_rev_8_21_14_0_10_42_34]|nr:MAG: hypothetical protein COT85_05410 [Chlamydiae bacterium CG10_big_fil_rev_8_21_14_0_10_42_34]